MEKPRHRKRLIITLQLKNAEVYPGSNLHGTVILQLMHKHNSNRYRTSSVDSVDLTPKMSSAHSPKMGFPNLTVIDKVSINVSGICNINPYTDTTHFPPHLKQENDTFNILRGKENILGRALQLKQPPDINHNNSNSISIDTNNGEQHTESIQFDFVVSIPPVLPCSYSGYFIQYIYYAQLFVTISKHVHPTKCRVPFYILPISASSNGHQNGKVAIPNLMVPMNLQERMSIFRKRKKSQQTQQQKPKLSLHSASSSSSISSYVSFPVTPKVIDGNEANDHPIYKPSPSLLLPPSDSHFIENNVLSNTHSNLQKLEEKDNISTYLFDQNNDNHKIDNNTNNVDEMEEKQKYQYYLRRNSLSLNYRDSNSLNNGDDYNYYLRDNHQNNKFKISLENKSIGILLLNDTVFCDGECIEGYLSLYTPCIVKVTLVHIERCGATQKHLTNCCSSYQCCWYSPSFTFTLKIPNNAFKSFRSDLCESSWSLHFEFAISRHLLSNKTVIQSPSTIKKQEQDELGYLNTSYDVWKLHEIQNNHNNNDIDIDSDKQIDKILRWNLDIIVTTIHNPLRCVTRSNAVVVKC